MKHTHQPKGYLTLHLHAHLPYVRHPEYPDFLEEDWLYEAITECYIPLLQMMERLWSDGIPFRLSMTMTPPLCEMLADDLLQTRYVAKMKKLLELAELQANSQKENGFTHAAKDFARNLKGTLKDYESWGRNLLAVFRKFQDRGSLELSTCGATHGFLPLMVTEEARRAQIEVAADNYEKHFGERPRGIWLPECAYTPALDELLVEAGIRFFFVESHGLTNSNPPARFGTARPIYTPHGLAVFGRDQKSSHQVWSATDGYPGDPAYREFYRDLGFDLPYEEVRPYLHDDGVRRNTGIKLHRITGKVSLDKKRPYIPSIARERAAAHAGDFLQRCREHIREIQKATGVAPHITTPYDAELFGHWWSEGPMFLEFFLRKAACDQDELLLVTPSEYLSIEATHQVAVPATSSWGAEGFFKVWLNEGNDWIYRHLHHAEEMMVELADHFPNPTPLELRALNQAARELLLAQSSDWAFIITMDTSAPYAAKRTRDHLHRFHELQGALMKAELNAERIGELEHLDNIFSEIDHRIYRSRS